MKKYSNAYFAASNSSCGFISYFNKIFSCEELNKIYILKGGPGTGKSHLMSYIGKTADKLGYNTEYFLCSSDPGSLDGIIIPELKTAIIDGTSPHMTDPIYPGAVEEIINLGEFFNVEMLEDQREKIISLINAKKELYRRAYTFLGCAGSLQREYDSTVCPYVLYQKMSDYISRLCRRVPTLQQYKESVRITKAYSTDGVVTLDTFYENAAERFVIKDKYRISGVFFLQLLNKLKEKNQAVTVSYCPDTPERIDGIYLPDSKISFTIMMPNEEKNGKIINMDRFIKNDSISVCKKRLRFIQNAHTSVLNEALSYLAAVKALHAETEDIYIHAMDFERKERFERKLSKRIFDKR
ncbi:MAG: hypothetical protein IKT65_07470 [Clostridia bacterium]|nr:hypothetical protein [Clostridia bacterium]